MRPIDADALLEQLAEAVRRADEDAAYTGNRSSELSWDMAVRYIKNAPTIELLIKGKLETPLHSPIEKLRDCSNCLHRYECKSSGKADGSFCKWWIA